MQNNSPTWIATRDAALAALQQFLPRAGRDYTDQRNEDRGPADRANVSGLSPWVRVRLLTEFEVVAAVLGHHSFAAAEKFIQEVCWRTYWKGWLEARPAVWKNYQTDLEKSRGQEMSSPRYREAIEGRTGIDCFDAFARELIDTGYLHNHARMWFASIWIFTLRLPWVLGADFFMRHLLDGDPASNTLSWRWVGGLQTAGKHYVATAENIRRCTAGRFRVDASLAQNPPPLESTFDLPSPSALSEFHEPLSSGSLGLLVGEDDLSSPRWLGRGYAIETTAFAMPTRAYEQTGIATRVKEFRQAAMTDAANAAGSSLVFMDEPGLVAAIVAWAREHRLNAVLMAAPPVGLWDDLTPVIAEQLGNTGIRLVLRRHPWDQSFYPHATRGFFHLKKSMEKIIRSMVSPAG
jgi:deoxyribodipyrimidine photo-lyase